MLIGKEVGTRHIEYLRIPCLHYTAASSMWIFFICFLIQHVKIDWSLSEVPGHTSQQHMWSEDHSWLKHKHALNHLSDRGFSTSLSSLVNHWLLTTLIKWMTSNVRSSSGFYECFNGWSTADDQLHRASSVLRLQADIRERWWFECEICKPCSASCVLFLASGVPACGDTPGNSKEELAEMQADWQPVLPPLPRMLDLKDGDGPTAVCSAPRLYWCFQQCCWMQPSVTSGLQYSHSF